MWGAARGRRLSLHAPCPRSPPRLMHACEALCHAAHGPGATTKPRPTPPRAATPRPRRTRRQLDARRDAQLAGLVGGLPGQTVNGGAHAGRGDGAAVCTRRDLHEAVVGRRRGVAQCVKPAMVGGVGGHACVCVVCSAGSGRGKQSRGAGWRWGWEGAAAEVTGMCDGFGAASLPAGRAKLAGWPASWRPCPPGAGRLPASLVLHHVHVGAVVGVHLLLLVAPPGAGAVVVGLRRVAGRSGGGAVGGWGWAEHGTDRPPRAGGAGQAAALPCPAGQVRRAIRQEPSPCGRCPAGAPSPCPPVRCR